MNSIIKDSIIKAKNISKTFSLDNSKKLKILDNVSLEIEPGEITVIIGASGAGKSTLLHILSGLDKPDTGKILIDNQNILMLNDLKLSSFRNKNIGFVFQFHHLLPEFTALENCAIPLLIKGDKKNIAYKKATEILTDFGLANRLNEKPATLSGGEQQRIAIARAIINNPKIVFADEPTGNLDSKNSEEIHQMFLDLKKKYNQTFLIVTHNKDLMKLADRVIEIKDGILI